jgi:hypothetical protein
MGSIYFTSSCGTGPLFFPSLSQICRIAQFAGGGEVVG